MRKFENICLPCHISFFSATSVILCMLCNNLMKGQVKCLSGSGRSRHGTLIYPWRLFLVKKQILCLIRMRDIF